MNKHLHSTLQNFTIQMLDNALQRGTIQSSATNQGEIKMSNCISEPSLDEPEGVNYDDLYCSGEIFGYEFNDTTVDLVWSWSFGKLEFKVMWETKAGEYVDVFGLLNDKDFAMLECEVMTDVYKECDRMVAEGFEY